MSDLGMFIMDNGSNADDYVDYNLWFSNHVMFSLPLVDVLEKATDGMLVELEEIFMSVGSDFRKVLSCSYLNDIIIFIDGDGYFGLTSKRLGTYTTGVASGFKLGVT